MVNPFRFSGPLPPEEMVDRAPEAKDLLDLVEGGHSLRLLGPRRYGKTTLLRRLLDDADRVGMATCLVDLEDVLTLGEIVVRIERAYAERLKGPIRRTVEALFRSWNVGLSLGAGGFAATLRHSPRASADVVLLRLLELPRELHRRKDVRSAIVFDEFQDVLAVHGADGKFRSVVQHQLEFASYAFAGSAPSAMEALFSDPKRPLLDQAVAKDLAPLPIDAVAEHVEDRFKATKRDPATALPPLLEFTRGHPMRAMMLAHFLWARCPEGGSADEEMWLETQEAALRQASPTMRALWRALPLNERRASLALANLGSPYVRDNAAAVGLNLNSVGAALEGLRDRADIIDADGAPRLTDPLFELWLQRRGVLATDLAGAQARETEASA
jgi:uncharacterized protein